MNYELFRTFVAKMKKLTIKLTKKRFLTGFAAVVLLLAVIRWIFPSVAEPRVIMHEIAEAVMPSSLQTNGRPHRIRLWLSEQICSIL